MAWAPGDLAICVRGGRGKRSAGKLNGVWCCESTEGAVTEGVTYIVRRVRFTDAGEPYLGLIEVPGPWLANRFRKAKAHTADAEDRETIRLLNGQSVPVEA